jgi:hypothetical protein
MAEKKIPEERIPRVEFENIDKLGVSFTKSGVKVSFEIPSPSPEVLKLVHYKLSGLALNVVISSPQAEFDLRIEEVSVKTGELKQK